MGEDDDVMIEVEALQAVYGHDCLILESSPPHIHLHIKPRTADISSQQFVEAVIRIKAGPQYPKVPPHIDIIESKGLDEKRQKHLITCIQEKACELSSCSMLVSLCEEAVEELTLMNHPDGDCPLCLYPLASENEQNKILPFMKLMSCFHCFHVECIIRWWKWIHIDKETNATESSSATVCPTGDVENKKDIHGESMGNCPVCRKVFHAQDLNHVLDLVATQSLESISDGNGVDDCEKLLQSDSENIRRQKFEAILKLQQENNGLIEPKKNLVIQPGMFLPQPVMPPPTSMSTEGNIEHQKRDAAITTETNSSGSKVRPSTSEYKTSGTRKPRARNSRTQAKQWVRKENGSAD